MKNPKTSEPILAKISSLGIGGQLTWYEVISYDPEDKEWCFNGGSDTAENLGWTIRNWVYVKDCFE